MKEPKEDESSTDWMSSADNQVNVSEWIGAIFYSVMSRGTKKFKDIYTPKNHKRNMWAGYLILLILLTIAILIAILSFRSL